jgi:hypothetical protein
MFDKISQKLEKMKIEKKIKQKIARGEDIPINLDKLRNTPDYLVMLTFSMLGKLDDLKEEGKTQVEIGYEEIPDNSFQSVIDFIKSKGLYDLLQMDFLIDQADKEFERKLNNILDKIRDKGK